MAVLRPVHGVPTMVQCGRDDPSPALDAETVDGIIRKLVEIDTKLERILEELEIDEEEEGDDA